MLVNELKEKAFCHYFGSCAYKTYLKSSKSYTLKHFAVNAKRLYPICTADTTCNQKTFDYHDAVRAYVLSTGEVFLYYPNIESFMKNREVRKNV